jgi:hypothetical protein
MKSTRFDGLDLAEWLECLTANAKVLGSNPASSDTKKFDKVLEKIQKITFLISS